MDFGGIPSSCYLHHSCPSLPLPLPATVSALHSLLEKEGIPVDELRVVANIKRDKRHASKPDTAALFRHTPAVQRLWRTTDAVLIILGGSVGVFTVVLAIFIGLLFFVLL